MRASASNAASEAPSSQRFMMLDGKFVVSDEIPIMIESERSRPDREGSDPSGGGYERLLRPH